MRSGRFSLEDYDSIGFDLDCTIAEYNVPNLCKLVYELLVKYLIEKKQYDSDFFRKPFEESRYFLQKGLFMDLKKGNVLKIDGEGCIVRGTHGTAPLTDEEICGYYGTEKILTDFKGFIDNPLSIFNTPVEKIIRATLDCFDMSCVLLFARIVDELDERNGGASQEYNIWPDILSGLYFLYSRNNFASGESEFYSELGNNPSQYYKKCSPKKLKWLKELKAKKFVFLLTGSFIDVASNTAAYCLGDDWKDYFHFVSCYARKPFFFSPGHPYLRVKDAKEIEMLKGEELQMNSVYSQGNWEELKTFISRETGVKEPKCLYVGDNIIQDVFSPSHFKCCDSVAVSLELLPEFQSSKLWGSYFGDNNNHTSYWNKLIRRHAKICVADLDVFANRPFNFSYTCLKVDATESLDQESGYFVS